MRAGGGRESEMTMMDSRRRFLGGVLCAVSWSVSGLAQAQDTSAIQPGSASSGQGADPAALAVQDFYDVLFNSMRHAAELKMRGRYDRLYPAMVKIFDVPTMTRLAVGPEFARLSPDQQANLRDAFGKLLVATFASTFDDFKGERYTVDGDVLPQGADKLVKSRFIGEGAPVAMNFVLRGKAESWRVIDIYLNGTISQLATWRSQYGSNLQTAGYDGMMQAVQKQIDNDMSAF